MITPEQARVIEEAIESALIDVHTALPGIVETYDSTTKTVDVEIQTKRLLEKADGTYYSEELPKLINVPIVNIGSSTYAMGFALSAGDEGWIMLSETSLDQWRSKGYVTSPSDIERHGLSGAVFLPCPLSLEKVITTALTTGAFFGATTGVQLRANGTTMEVTTSGAATAADFVALATATNTQLEEIRNLLKTWTPVPQDGGAALKTAAAALWATPSSSVGSSNLKAD